MTALLSNQGELTGEPLLVSPEGQTIEPLKLQRPLGEVGANIQRCLVVGSRGVSHRERHLMHDLLHMLPHARSDSKVKGTSERGGSSSVIGDLCYLHNCNTVLFLDAHKSSTTMWVGQHPDGPSMSFMMQNVATSRELKMTGNCLKYSRPVLHFDYEFSVLPHFQILRALLTNIFGTPHKHPKSKPFIDHVFSFFVADGHVWFRNYQIHTDSHNKNKRELLEIGPRFALEPLVLHDGFLRGTPLWAASSSLRVPTGGGTALSSVRLARKERLLAKRRAVPKKKKKPGIIVPNVRSDPEGSLFQHSVE